MFALDCSVMLMFEVRTQFQPWLIAQVSSIGCEPCYRVIMMINVIDAVMALSDGDLLTGIAALVRRERETTAELVAHLAVLELRPNLYLAQGYDSLYG